MSSALSMCNDRYGWVRKKSYESAATTAAAAPGAATAGDGREHDHDHEDEGEVRR